MSQYNPTSHFFVDESKLAAILPANYTADAFGPVTGSLTTKYRTSSFVRAVNASPVKVFAICDGQLFIQPVTGDATKLNLILKPSKTFAPIKIKYFIYRGVRKSDLLGGVSGLSTYMANPDPSDPNQPKFLKKIWAKYTAFVTSITDPGTGDPLPEPTEFYSADIGYDENQVGTVLLDHCFTKKDISNPFYEIPLCKEGEHIANFTTKMALDIVLDYGDYELVNQEQLFKLDLDFARKRDHFFDTTTITNFAKIKRYKEHVHQFLDPAAFWGSHIECGLIKTISTPDGICDNNFIYTSFLNKYQTRNKVYIYIQGEKNRSYNYYEATRKVYGFDAAGKLNDTNGWPITIEEITLTTATTTFKEGKNIQLEYNIDTNIHKLERHVSIDIVAPNNESKYPLLQRQGGDLLGSRGQMFNYNLTKLVDPSFTQYSLFSGALPSGLTLSVAGLLSGIPTTLVDTDITFRIATTTLPVHVTVLKLRLVITDGKTSSSTVVFPVNGMKSCSIFVFVFANLRQEFPIKDYFNELWPVTINSNFDIPANDANQSTWCTYDRSRMVNLDDVADIAGSIQNKLVFDTGKIAATSSSAQQTKKRRLYMAILKRNSTHDVEFDALNIDTITAGLSEVTKTNDQYALNLYNDLDYSIYKGTFTDPTETDPINSLTLFHNNSLSKKNSYFHLGITEEDYNKLVYNQPTVPTIVAPATTIVQYLPLDADNVFFQLQQDLTFLNQNVTKYKVGLRYEDSSGALITVPLFPTSPANDVFVYTIDGLYFFSREYSKFQEHYKEFAKAKVEFRTVPTAIPASGSAPAVNAYNGEFGFDWLRIGDNGEPSYESIIVGGYERPTLLDSNTEYEYNGTVSSVFNDAAKALKREYKSIPTQIVNDQYYIPYLNLFSQIYSSTISTNAPPFEAILRVLVTIDETVSKLEFDYDANLFTIDKPVLSDKLSTLKVESVDKTIKITCLKDFSELTQIKILAYPVGVTDKKQAKLAGLILLNKNDVFTRKLQNIVLVKAQTDVDIDTVLEYGIFNLLEKNNLINALHQVFVHANVVENLTYFLPLEANADFQSGGAYIDVSVPGSYYIKHYATGLQDFLHNHFISLFPMYNDYFTIFSFGIQTKPDASGNIVVGNVQAIGKHNVNLFDGRGNFTLCHESLHGFGLYHTHKDGTIINNPNIKYIYPNGNPFPTTATDNYMSYSGNIRKSIWNWQIKVVNKNLEK